MILQLLLYSGSIGGPQPTLAARTTVPNWLHWTDEKSMVRCKKACNTCTACHKTAYYGCSWGQTSLAARLGSTCMGVQDYFGAAKFLWGGNPKVYVGGVNITACDLEWKTWASVEGPTYQQQCMLEHERCEANSCSNCWKCRKNGQPKQRCGELCKKADFCHLEISKRPTSGNEYGLLLACEANPNNKCKECDTCETLKDPQHCTTECGPCNTCRNAAYNGTQALHAACSPLEVNCRNCLHIVYPKARRKRIRDRARIAKSRPKRNTRKKERRVKKRARKKARKTERRAKRSAQPTVPNTYAPTATPMATPAPSLHSTGAPSTPTPYPTTASTPSGAPSTASTSGPTTAGTPAPTTGTTEAPTTSGTPAPTSA